MFETLAPAFHEKDVEKPSKLDEWIRKMVGFGKATIY